MSAIAHAEIWLQTWLMGLTPLAAMGWSVLQNLAQLAVCVGGGWLVQRLWPERRIAPAAPALTRVELQVATGTVLANTAVTWLGWQAWRMGYIRIRPTGSLGEVLWDVGGLLLAMDLALYVGHRLAHWPPVFAKIHSLHHRYDRVRPLTLFVLSPLEVVGFGGMWLAVLALWQPSWLAMVLYLLLNAAWGAIGHTGIEVAGNRLGLLTGGRFHADHHLQPHGNFGFYTGIWDRLLRTRLAGPEGRGSTVP